MTTVALADILNVIEDKFSGRVANDTRHWFFECMDWMKPIEVRDWREVENELMKDCEADLKSGYTWSKGDIEETFAQIAFYAMLIDMDKDIKIGDVIKVWW